MQPTEHWLKHTSVPAGDGRGGGGLEKAWNWEMWYGELCGRKTKLFKPQAFPLIKIVSSFYWIQHVYGGGNINGLCECVDVAAQIVIFVHIFMRNVTLPRVGVHLWLCPCLNVFEHMLAKFVFSPPVQKAFQCSVPVICWHFWRCYQRALSLALHYILTLYLIILSFSTTFPLLSSQLVMQYLAAFKILWKLCLKRLM